jgi:hypothetical protein
MAKKFDVKAIREKVLGTDDVVYKTVYVDEWETEVPIKTLTAPELKEIMKHKNDEIRVAILAVLYGCVTEDGERVFEREDLAIFETKKSFGPIAKLSAEIMKISGLGENAVKDAKNS